MRTEREEVPVGRRAGTLVALLVVSPLLGLFGYSAVHEAGHAAVALANGAQVERFAIGPGAHVAWSGGSFSQGAASLTHGAGALLPALLLLGALLVYRPTVRSDAYHTVYAVVAASTTASLLAWVAIPVIAMVGTPPPGDDVTRFLATSGFPAPALAASAALAVGGLVAVAVRRRLPQTWVAILRDVAAEQKARTQS